MHSQQHANRYVHQSPPQDSTLPHFHAYRQQGHSRQSEPIEKDIKMAIIPSVHYRYPITELSEIPSGRLLSPRRETIPDMSVIVGPNQRQAAQHQA